MIRYAPKPFKNVHQCAKRFQSVSSESEKKIDKSQLNKSSVSNVFSKAKTGSFTQTEPKHPNAFLSDPFLIRCLRRIIPPDVFQGQVEQDLVQFGEAVSGPIWQLGRDCEEQPPILKKTDPWGKTVDQIITCQAWKDQKKISAREGLISIAYERKQGQFSRVYQVAKLMLYSPASGLYSCPLAMTDGAAKTIEGLSSASRENPELKEAYTRLTSRDPEQFWTSGQWMTEKKGGSDVARGTETLAVAQPDGSYKLYGYKWFSSATDSDMTLTLARIVDEDGKTVDGTPGVSMFFARTRDPQTKELNGIEVMKMKNKLGTRQLPTAELLLDGTRADLISTEGRGIASITNMLTITRLHNVTSSAACQRKILSLAKDYSKRRTAFGEPIENHSLHLHTLGQMETDARGCTVLVMDLARQLGLEDTGFISDSDRLLLRLMMPVAKMYTAKKAVANASEGLECFGGQGYIEDTGLPTILRDAQVLPIWEGTSNVMALDVLRAIAKTRGESLRAFAARVTQITSKAANSNLPQAVSAGAKISGGLNELLNIVTQRQDLLQIAGRDFAFSLAHIYIGALLLEHSLDACAGPQDVFTAHQWTMRDLVPISTLANQEGYVSPASLKDFVFEEF